jgi:hypothetical protein
MSSTVLVTNPLHPHDLLIGEEFVKIAFREFLHFFKVQVLNFESILVKIEEMSNTPKMSKTKQKVEGAKTTIPDQLFPLNNLQDSSTKNTLCSTCGVVCHFDCRCIENSPISQHQCIIFSSGTTCHSCPAHCDINSHYQSRKTIATMTSSLEEIILELRGGSSFVNLSTPATSCLQLSDLLEIVEGGLASIDNHFEIVFLNIINLGCQIPFDEELSRMMLSLRTQIQDPSSLPTHNSQQVIDRTIGVFTRIIEEYFSSYLENLNQKVQSQSLKKESSRAIQKKKNKVSSFRKETTPKSDLPQNIKSFGKKK